MSCPAPIPVAGTVRVVFAPYLPGRACRLAEGAQVSPGEDVIVESEAGHVLGCVARFELPVWRDSGAPMPIVLRAALPEEIERAAELAEVERDSLRFCREWAAASGQPMQPVAAVAPLDRSYLLVTFAAEQRIDFRDLLRDLGRRSRRRVELRQIGVRDQAKANSGWGPCGRVLCCAAFMERFSSVTIRMAKAQNLSLNPARISGMCGRLMCCLNHEMTKAPARGRRQGT